MLNPMLNVISETASVIRGSITVALETVRSTNIVKLFIGIIIIFIRQIKEFIVISACSRTHFSP